MPEDAARRFAVVGAVDPLYNKNIIIWKIMLHAITKDAAQEAETSGLPVSAAPFGKGSDCDTYAGDVSREDLEKEDELLAADEVELNAYLDTAVTMAKSDLPTDSEDGAENADNTDDIEEPPEEDEEDSIIPVLTKGLCKYCGQVVEVGPCTHQTEAAKAAAWGCKCAKASAARHMCEQITDAQEHVNRLFDDRAVDLNFKPIAGDGVIEVKSFWKLGNKL